jgi:hypothetical protein
MKLMKKFYNMEIEIRRFEHHDYDRCEEAEPNFFAILIS